MTMKVKAIEKKLKFTKDPNDPYRCVMQPEQDCKNNKRSRLCSSYFLLLAEGEGL